MRARGIRCAPRLGSSPAPISNRSAPPSKIESGSRTSEPRSHGRRKHVTLKIFAVLLLAMSTGAVGEVLLKMGMEEVGEVAINSMGDLLRHPFIIFRSKMLLIGLLFMATHFYSYLALLSLAD